MNIDIVRERLVELLFQNHTFLYVGTRGQNEKFVGQIIKVYPRCFLIETDKGTLKSFSYSDFVIHSLKIVG